MESTLVECFTAKVHSKKNGQYSLVLQGQRLLLTDLPKEKHGRLKCLASHVRYDEKELTQHLFEPVDIQPGDMVVLHLASHDRLVRWQHLPTKD